MIPTWSKNLPWNVITKKSNQHGIDSHLVASIIQVESAGDPWAIRYEPNWKYFTKVEYYAKINKISMDTEMFLQSCSLGMMQVMGSVVREYGFKDNLTKVIKIIESLDYGIMHLKKFLKKYTEIEEVIASYNAGAPRYNSDVKLINKHYVDMVMAYMAQLNK